MFYVLYGSNVHLVHLSEEPGNHWQAIKTTSLSDSAWWRDEQTCDLDRRKMPRVLSVFSSFHPSFGDDGCQDNGDGFFFAACILFEDGESIPSPHSPFASLQR